MFFSLESLLLYVRPFNHRMSSAKSFPHGNLTIPRVLFHMGEDYAAIQRGGRLPPVVGVWACSLVSLRMNVLAL